MDMLDISEDQLRQRLEEMRQEHSDLDLAIQRIGESPPYDELQLMRLKRKKLNLKDEIQRVENMLVPDIIA